MHRICNRKKAQVQQENASMLLPPLIQRIKSASTYLRSFYVECLRSDETYGCQIEYLREEDRLADSST